MNKQIKLEPFDLVLIFYFIFILNARESLQKMSQNMSDLGKTHKEQIQVTRLL